MDDGTLSPEDNRDAEVPSSNVKSFAQETFLENARKHRVMFPLMEECEVNGDKASDVFKFLRVCSKELQGNELKHNFGKFLVDHEGTVVKYFDGQQNKEDVNTGVR